MAYTIDTYSNSRSWKIEDGTIDQTTDLKLVGKNYAGYGEIQNENFVFLLENFAGQSEPPRKITGQLWFDTGNSKLRFYDGLKWRTTGGAEVSDSTPTGLKEGDFWWDTANQQLYTYNGGDFVLIGPQSAGSGQTQIVSRAVRDTLGISRGIITAVVNDEIVGVFSNVEFTIDTNDVDSNINGFDKIHPGFTLKNTLNGNAGVTSGAAEDGAYRLWGTSTNSDKLGGSPASSYVRTDSANFGGLARFAETGIQIADNGSLKLKVELDNKAVIANESGTQIEFRTKNSFGSILNPVRILPNAVIPGFVPGTELTNPTIAATSLGTDDYPWPNIYADYITGLSSAAEALIVVPAGQSYDPAQPLQFAKYPSVTSVANTIVIRDENSDIYADYFRGIATEALYADLAEKYTTEGDLPVGTVVSVCDHDEHEVCPCESNLMAFGVISGQPAYLMNAEADGQAVGLKGRLPVRIIGPVRKGQPVYASSNGTATALNNNGSLVGIALETNTDESEKLVECVLKV